MPESMMYGMSQSFYMLSRKYSAVYAIVDIYSLKCKSIVYNNFYLQLAKVVSMLVFAISLFHRRCVAFCCLLFLLTLQIQAQEINRPVILTYDIGSTSAWVPFGYSGNQVDPGILVELVRLIMQEAQIELHANSLPPKRAVRALETGELDFDIVSPNWFKDGNIGDNYVSSDVIINVTEYFITLPENANKYQTLKQIYGGVIGTVAGYSYVDDNKFTRADFRSESELMLGLKKHRYDVAIMEKLAALYWAQHHNVALSFAAIHTTGGVVFRLRKEHQSLVPRINKVIKKFQQNGQINQVVNKYQSAKLLNRIYTNRD
ncbi:hypothetical protein tinsulaeT_06090 [Thalassotalea insulae]|uniref:Solute-binding protein family 3/N-terminal domain-containing protein n=2 Tax=Thalassotalea insulae TaxID=2056778 RepID=A0ABQ6GPM4_9GAMM|nr:hypothetical protein tinsulaeT_06090 [Thalassotalea insulae]